MLSTCILVIGYNRPYHLQAVLESLRLQDKLSICHVWIDGTQGRAEYKNDNIKTIEIAKRYHCKEVRLHWGHLGIEKLMLDALKELTSLYDSIIILEDDCFPIEGSIDKIIKDIELINKDKEIYSVYGHHFECESDLTRKFSRFQGWGWASTSEKIKKVLPELERLFLLSEKEYLKEVDKYLTQSVIDRLDITPGRDVINVLRHGFSWDSATAMLCASYGLDHLRTEKKQIYNTGFSKNVGHFESESKRLLNPPFNIIPLQKAWNFFDTSSKACDFTKNSYGLEGLDTKLIEHVNSENGFFVEVGAYDGVTQSNSVILEKKGWKGMLIEACPSSFAKCVRRRPSCIVENYACVSESYKNEYIDICDVGLMSVSNNSNFSAEEKQDWLDRGASFNRNIKQLVSVKSSQISKIFDSNNIKKIDLLIIDVEGAECDLLKGLDFQKHAPIWILCEDSYDESVFNYLKDKNYILVDTLLERRFTRDRLYKLKN